jgi:hypothetical protein
MPHGLDVSRLGVIFEELRDNTEKLNDWENARLEEWWEHFENGGKFSDRQLEIIEKMYLKV